MKVKNVSKKIIECNMNRQIKITKKRKCLIQRVINYQKWKQFMIITRIILQNNTLYYCQRIT